MKKSNSYIIKVVSLVVLATCSAVPMRAGGLGDLWKAWADYVLNNKYGAIVAAQSTGNGKVYVETSEDDPDIGADASGGAKGTDTPNQSVTFSIKAFPADGYKFEGWDDRNPQYGQYVSTENPYTITIQTAWWRGANNATSAQLYAFFSLMNYTITYDTDGGILTPSGNSQTYNIESTGTVKTASKTGYSFDGWKITTTGGNWPAVHEIISAGSSLMGKFGNVELKALWTPLLADITISVSGLDSNDSAIFTVSNGTGVLYTVALSGSNPSVTIKDLPTGVNYTVKATSNWSWAYGDPDPTGYTFGLGSSGYTASFEYTKKSSVKKHDEQQKVNWKEL